MQTLTDLSASDLAGLAAALRSGRLVPPFSTAAMQRFVAPGVAANVCGWMTQTSSAGCSPDAMAMCFEALAANHGRRSPVEDFVHLVTTGPEGADADHRDTAVVVQDLFRRARESLLISGYALYQGRSLFQTLAERMESEPDLHVRMFLDIQANGGDGGAGSEAIARFVYRFKEQHWPEKARLPEIYFDRRSMATSSSSSAVLHAKCIVIDTAELFVSSANFTDAAQHRNVEVGLLVTSGAIAEQAVRFFDSLVRSECCARAV